MFQNVSVFRVLSTPGFGRRYLKKRRANIHAVLQKQTRKIQRKWINVDFLLSKLFFFGVSSMGLRTMVGSGQKIEDME